MNAKSCSAETRVVTYPAPAEEAIHDEYRVMVNGQPVAVYGAKTQHHDKRYFFAYFDFAGTVEIEVTSVASLAETVIRPEGQGVTLIAKSAESLTLAATRPFGISVEPDGQNSPLLLFGNPLETDAPNPGDPGVVYFGPGVHRPGKIELTDNQTLYVAGGAVVKGGVEARGDNILILGRGIIDGSDYPHGSGPTRFMVTFETCRNVTMRDVIVRGSWLFTIAPCGCAGVAIRNVKICGSRVDNDDGIDLINSSDVTIEDCFVRTDDDCIAVKGLLGYEGKACERIRIARCAFWADRANIFRIGYESDAEAMRDISAHDIDVLHFVSDERPPDTFWSHWVFYLQPSNNMPMSRLRFADFRVNAGGSNNLIKAQPMLCRGWGKVTDGHFASHEYTVPGQCVEDLVFQDIRVTGAPGGHPGCVYIHGVDAQHPVENVTIENLDRFGEAVAADSPDVNVGPHARNIRFLAGEQP